MQFAAEQLFTVIQTTKSYTAARRSDFIYKFSAPQMTSARCALLT